MQDEKFLLLQSDHSRGVPQIWATRSNLEEVQLEVVGKLNSWSSIHPLSRLRERAERFVCRGIKEVFIGERQILRSVQYTKGPIFVSRDNATTWIMGQLSNRNTLTLRKIKRKRVCSPG
jgi:hypothetical protein